MKDIDNMVKIGLFFRAFSSKCLMPKSEQCASRKILKQLTASFCVNEVGEKEVPLVINKSLCPRCLKKTYILHGMQIKKLKMHNQNRKVILLLDNAPCHATQL